jgi:hypothetical protein
MLSGPLGIDQHHRCDTQLENTITKAMTPADKKSPNVKNRTNVTKGLLSEAPGIFEEEEVIGFPSAD